MPAAIENDRAVVPPAASQLLKTMLRCRNETDVHWRDVASVTTAEPNDYVSVKAEPPAGGSTTAFTSMVYASFR